MPDLLVMVKTLFTLILYLVSAVVAGLIAFAASSTSGRPQHRIPLKSYHPKTAPDRTAGKLFKDPQLIRVIRSERSSLGIYRTSQSINWDAGVLNDAQRDGAVWVETYIKDLKITYRATMQTIRQYGVYRNVHGGQIALALKYWSVDIPAGGQKPNDPPAQLNLF